MKKAIVCAVLGIGSLMMAQQTPNRQEAREQKRIENQKAIKKRMCHVRFWQKAGGSGSQGVS